MRTNALKTAHAPLGYVSGKTVTLEQFRAGLVTARKAKPKQRKRKPAATVKSRKRETVYVGTVVSERDIVPAVVMGEF